MIDAVNCANWLADRNVQAFLRMLRVGERSGEVASMLERAAAFHDEEAARLTGSACHADLGRQGAAALVQKLAGQGLAEIVVVRDGVKGALALPGGIVLVSNALVVGAEDAEPLACKYFWSGASGHFYTNTLEQGEMIVKHLPDSDDYTATELTSPKDNEPVGTRTVTDNRAELVRRIEESTSQYQPDESITDLLKDIRDYLEGE